MSLTTEERLTAALHDAARDLRPPPGLAAAAVEQSRRVRHRVATAFGATAIAVTAVIAAVMLLPAMENPAVADGPLAVAPDWSGCAARLPIVNDVLGTAGLDPTADPVEVAVCGPVVPGDDEVTMNVHVAGTEDARRIARRVLGSSEGSLAEGCIYEVKCEPTFFALRMADGSVARLVVTDLGRGALVSDASTSRVGAVRVLEAVEGVQATAPWHTYHADDTPPPPLAFGDFACPDDVPHKDWETYVASPDSGAQETLTEPIDRVVICAYRPWDSAEDPVQVLVGIGYADQEAADLVAVIEGAPLRDESEGPECNDDAGLAYVVLAGSGETFSHALYAETFGCHLAGEVTPGATADERLAPRFVTDGAEAALLAAVGPENLQ